MLMVRKNQYRENGHTAQGSLQIIHYPHQVTNDLLHRTKKTYLKLHIEPKESPNSQDNPKQKTKLEHHTTGLQTILQGYSNQNSMVLVYRPMEQNRGLRGNATCLQPSDL